MSTKLAATGPTTVLDALRVGGITSTRSGRFRKYAREAVDSHLQMANDTPLIQSPLSHGIRIS